MRASSASSSASAAVRPARPGRTVIAAVGLAAMLLPLNSTMLAVALPDIASDTGGGVAASSWLVTAYVVAMAALGPFAGRLGDRLGRRRVVLAGLAAFAAASAAAGVAPSLALLVVARLGQAVAGSLVVPNAMAILRTELPAGRRAAGYGLMGSLLGVAAATGPALGGVLVDAFDWRAIFLVNLPVAAVATALVLRAVPTASSAHLAANSAVNCALDESQTASGSLRRLTHPRFVAATAATGLSNMAMYTTLLAIPVVLSHRAGWSSGDAGLALALMSAVMVVVSIAGGRLADRLGHRTPAVVGLGALAVAMVGLAAMGAAPGVGGLVATMTVAGAGLGLANAPLQTSAIEAVAAADAGLASGVYSTGRYLGSIVSAILLATLLGDSAGAAATLFAIAAAAATIAAALALTLATRRPELALQRA